MLPKVNVSHWKQEKRTRFSAKPVRLTFVDDCLRKPTIIWCSWRSSRLIFAPFIFTPFIQIPPTCHEKNLPAALLPALCCPAVVGHGFARSSWIFRGIITIQLTHPFGRHPSQCTVKRHRRVTPPGRNQLEKGKRPQNWLLFHQSHRGQNLSWQTTRAESGRMQEERSAPWCVSLLYFWGRSGTARQKLHSESPKESCEPAACDWPWIWSALQPGFAT